MHCKIFGSVYGHKKNAQKKQALIPAFFLV